MSWRAPIDPSRARSRAATVTTGALGLAVVSVAALHLLRDDLPPMSSRLSEYAVGPSAAVMVAAFVATAVGLVSLAVAVAQPGAGIAWPRTTAALLLVSGVAMVATAAFPTSGAGTTSEAWHSATSALATLAALVAAALQGMTLLVARRRSTTDRRVAVLGLTALVPGALSPVLHDTPRTGLGQRLLWVVLVAWLARMAWVLGRPEGKGDRAWDP